MNFNQFPEDYREQRNLQVQQDIQREKELSNSKKNSTVNSIGRKPDVSFWAMGFTAIGFFVGLFVCWSKTNEVTANGGTYDWGGLFGSLFTTTIGGLVLGVIVGFIAKSIYANSVADKNNQTAKEETRFNSVAEQIRKEAASDCNTYTKDFEAEAQKLSVNFTESELAVQVIDWMTKGFANTIDSAERGSHIDYITIPFSFNVFTNKITCNLGEFDFELKRCRNLKGPLEQTALARAIASAVQLNIIMQYPKDASGTDIVTKITYSYGGSRGYNQNTGYVETIITYTAPNGNFESVKSW